MSNLSKINYLLEYYITKKEEETILNSKQYKSYIRKNPFLLNPDDPDLKEVTNEIKSILLKASKDIILLNKKYKNSGMSDNESKEAIVDSFYDMLRFK
jgi:hypothetical protein